MVDFRYHVISIVAIFVALAVGIVLGAGPLKGASDAALRDSVASFRTENSALRQQLKDAQDQVGLTDRFASQIAPGLVARRLPRTSVVIVRLAGVDSTFSDEVTTLMRRAGATVTGTVTLSGAWTGDAAQHALANAAARVSASSGPGVPGGGGPSGGGPGQRSRSPAPTPTGSGAATAIVSQVLARAIVGSQASSPSPTPSRSAGPVPGVGSAPVSGPVDSDTLRALASAGLVEVDGRLTRRAAVAVVLAPAAPDGAADSDLNRLVSLVGALRAASSGTVVAGPAGAARPGGLISAVRSDSAVDQLVSTVDSADRPAGAVAVVLAVLEQIQGGSGDYGAVGTTDGTMPQVLGVSAP